MGRERIQAILDLGNLPFWVGPCTEATNRSYPDVLPFVLGRVRDLGLFVQMPDPEVGRWVTRVYQCGSAIGATLSSDGLGLSYADDFFGFIEQRSAASLSESRVLEIGCGTGHLLRRLADEALEAIGIEPSHSAVLKSRRRGLDVTEGEFPNGSIAQRRPFDVIVLYAVLEHFDDPVECLTEARRSLAEGGKIILSVPDCSEHLESGDVGMLLHQHRSYFTSDSLRKTLAAAGLEVRALSASRVGGCIYCSAAVRRVRMSAFPVDDGVSERFVRLAADAVGTLSSFLDENRRTGRTIGVYCPGRITNLLHLASPEVTPRFFDDDPGLHGTFLPPATAVIESRESLLADPVDVVVVASRSFGVRIRNDLRRAGLTEDTEVILLEELVPAAPQETGQRAHPSPEPGAREQW